MNRLHFLPVFYSIFFSISGSFLLAQGEVANRGRIFYEHIHFKAEQAELLDVLGKEEGFGHGIAAIGDLDGDDISEIAVGTPTPEGGAVYIVFLTQKGKLKHFTKINSDPVLGGLPLTRGGNFGIRVEAIGDWNKDGVPDIAVGEPRGKLGVLMYGKVWLLFLNADGTLRDHVMFSGRTAGLMGELGRDQLFGMDITCIGDLDGNGQADLVVGAPELEEKGSGAAWVLLMNSPMSIGKAVMIKPELKKGDRFGSSVEGIEDVNEDGIPDLAIGAPGDDGTGLNVGAVYLMLMQRDGSILQQQIIRSNQHGFSGYLEIGDRFGSSLALMGDLNGDEIGDLVVGANLDDDGGKDKGLYTLFICNEI